jgi:hypothetical protein
MTRQVSIFPLALLAFTLCSAAIVTHPSPTVVTTAQSVTTVLSEGEKSTSTMASTTAVVSSQPDRANETMSTIIKPPATENVSANEVPAEAYKKHISSSATIPAAAPASSKHVVESNVTVVTNNSSVIAATDIPMPAMKLLIVQPHEKQDAMPDGDKKTAFHSLLPVAKIRAIGRRVFDSLALLVRFGRPLPRDLSAVRLINESMLVAVVKKASCNKSYYIQDGDRRIPSPSIAGAVLHMENLTVRIRENTEASPETTAGLPKESSGQIDVKVMEYVIPLGDHAADLRGITVKPVDNSTYHVYIPIEMSISTPTPLPGQGHHEEDKYEFLEAQKMCRRLFKAQGMQASVCTCNKMHGGIDEDMHTACVARIADRAYRAATKAGEVELAGKLYKKAVSCHKTTGKTSDGRAQPRDCLVRVLEWSVRKSAHLQTRQARLLLSSYEEGIEKEEDVTKASANNFVSRNMAYWALPHITTRILAVILYACGLIILLIGMADIAKHYRRHKSNSRRMDQFADLPDHARALYSRLFA